MRLVFPFLPEPLLFEENRVNVLIIEEPFTLRKTLKELSEQIAGRAGEYILSSKDARQDLSRLAEIVIDPIHPDTGSKRIAGKILKAAAEAAQEHEKELYSALTAANALAERLSLDMSFPAAFDPLEDPTELLRLFDFRLDSESMDIPQLLLEWMLMQREYFGKRLFILYGLKACLNREELSAFYHNALYEKLDLLLIESFQKGAALEEECVTIVDEDLCVIN